MDSPDQDLIRLLILNSTIRESEVKALTSWWSTEGLGDESLVNFLQREGVLRAGASKMLDLSRKGYVRIDSGSSLVPEESLHRLREGLTLYFRDEPGPNTITVTHPVELPTPKSPHFAQARLEKTSSRTVENPQPAAPSHSTSRIGDILGKCLLTDEIGRGGCGIVYRALHTTLKIPVAVKMLLAGSDSAVSEGFRSEALTLARLNHQNVVRVLDIDNGSEPYFILEYMEGPSLRELIRQSGRIQSDRAVAIMMQVASGLAAASSLGIVHRDVTPANILLMRDGTAKITDFGLAAFMADLNASPDLEARGTAAYMSPEQARGDTIDSRSDIYSLGATFYHALTGAPPFSGSTRNQILLRHAMEEPMPPHVIATEVSPAVSSLILKMMAKTPEARFPSFEALIDALKVLSTADRPAIDFKEGTSSGSSSSSKKNGWLSLLSGRHRSTATV